MKVAAAAVVILLGSLAPAVACDRPDALGTSRVIKVDAGAGIGRPYPALGLARGEIVLTFDDGPAPDSTPQILDLLACDCIRATFFMVGKRAEASPALVARARQEGHTIGSHSYSHRSLDRLPFDEAVADIRRGYAAIEANGARALLFRFPEYKSTPALVSFVRDRGGAVAGFDMSAQDWRGDAPEVAIERVRRLLDRRDRGLLSLHDNQKNTVALLPMVLAELRARRLRIVHLTTE